MEFVRDVEYDLDSIEDETQLAKDIEKKATAIQNKLAEAPRPSGFGLCSRCDKFVYQRTQYQKEVALCSGYFGESIRGLRPSREDPIHECYSYYPAGQMNIIQMTKLAVLIEPKKQIGFSFRVRKNEGEDDNSKD
jgi:hypothetical protein